MIIEIWVPLINNGVKRWTADVPAGIDWSTDEGAPSDFTDSDDAHAVRKFNILVNDTDMPAIRAHLQAKGSDAELYDDGDEQDKLTVDMVRSIRGKRGTSRDDAMDTFCTERTTADSQKLRDVLTHAVTRGVTPERATLIVERESLPEGDSIVRIVR